MPDRKFLPMVETNLVEIQEEEITGKSAWF
jgi:hypothetical protein